MKRPSVTMTVFAVTFVLLLWTHCMVVGTGAQGFSLKGVSYSNHGLVLLDEVGEGVAALNCVSDDPTCCSVGSTFPGQYFFPNSSMVPSQMSGSGYYRDRAADRVRLNRRDGATSGLFRCQIQTVANTMEDLYIGVYGKSEGSPVVSNVVNNGGTSRLTCTSSGGPATTVTWRRNCVALASSADYQQSQTVTNTMTATYSNTLTIGSGVTDRDGVYTCSVRNARGSSSGETGIGANYGSDLPVVVSLYLGDTPQSIGQPYSLSCLFNVGNGVVDSPSSYRWIGPDGSTVGTNNVLRFESLSESDVGEYGCQVTVGSGANERVGCAVTSVAPTIVVTVNGGTVMAGTQHTLTCSVTGAPSGSTKTYTWFKGGTVLPSCTSSQCIITSVQVSDAGTDYMCRVTLTRSGITAAVETGTSMLRVTLPNPMIRFRADSFAPYFVGLDFTWRCNVENPGPALLGVTADIVWSQDGGEVTSDSRITVRDVVVDSPGVEWDREVMFNPLSSVDRGSYTCTATIRPATANEYITNGVNTNTEELSVVTPTLTVSVSDPSTPRVLDVSPHNRFTLTCTASSLVSGGLRNLRKTVQWMRSIGSSSLVEITSATNGVTVTNSNLDQATGTSQITVTTTTAGQHSYMCRVSLDVSPATDDISGQDSSVVSVQGPVRPNAPTGLSSIVSSHDSATIQWTVTSISYDQETYRVEYGTESNRLTSTSSSVSSGSDITRTNFLLSVELSGLTRDTQYYYRVMASNTAGSITSAAPPMTFNTTDLAPEPPTSLQFSELTSTSYSFSWVAPVVINGVLTGHVITCDPQLDGLDDVTRSVGRDETSNVAVENFENGVMYDCSVQSRNNVGLSLPSSPVTFTTDEAAPTSSAVDFSLSRITVSGRSITVSWSPPNPTDRNGDIISYTVACSARVIGVTMVTMTYNQAGRHTLSGFRPFTTYDCAIVARNNAGTGPPVTTSITTPEDAPSAPENVMVDIIEGSPDMVDISWSPPSELNGIIREYMIECTNELGQSVNDNTQAEDIRLTELTPASSYMCNVSAATIIVGPPGMVDFVTVPAAPSGLVISGETNSRLTVSWRYDHPESGDNIFGYNIHVDDVIVGRTSGNDVLQYNITGLDPFTNYSIQVSAFNDNNGPRSGVVTAMTDEDIPGIVGCNSRWVVDGDTVTVNWDPPARPNGVILGYHIDLVSYTDGTPKTEVTVGGEERTYSFSIANFSLVPGVPYNVSIAANNSVGVGEECIVTDFTRELRPPNNTLDGLMITRSEDGTDIIITWNVLPLDKVMGFITLTITFLPSTSTGSRKRQTTTECTTSPCVSPYEAGRVRITGLSPLVAYNVEIQAANGNSENGILIGNLVGGVSAGLSLTTIVIIVVVVVATLLIVAAMLILLVIALWWRNQKKKTASFVNQASVNSYINAARLNSLVEGSPTELKQFTVKAYGESAKAIQSELLIYSSNLKILEAIGQGEFGVVYKGQLLKDLGQRVTRTVAIKTLKGFFDQGLVEGLLQECLLMQQLDHPNVLSITGVCLDGGQTPFLVMPFMVNGSLLSYLRSNRSKLVIPLNCVDDDDEETRLILLKQLLDMCLQVAKGMEYLASKRFIHRDLAARNCMIDFNYVIKVGDFGLAEQLETKDYVRQDRRDSSVKLPVKWLAPESLTDYVFSEKSDVWAYGITCWEIFSGGKAPYTSVNPKELSQMLEDGYRLDRPANAVCNDELFGTMVQCWNLDPTDRPPFSNLVKRLAVYLESMAGYLHVGAFDQQPEIESLGQGYDSGNIEDSIKSLSKRTKEDSQEIQRNSYAYADLHAQSERAVAGTYF